LIEGATIVTHMGFESTQELQAFLRQANRIANEMLAPEQRELTYGSCWIRFLGTGRQMEFGRVIRQEEVTLLMDETTVGNVVEKREAAEEIALGIQYGYLYGWVFDRQRPRGELAITHKLHVWPISLDTLEEAAMFRWRYELFRLDTKIEIQKAQTQLRHHLRSNDRA